MGTGIMFKNGAYQHSGFFFPNGDEEFVPLAPFTKKVDFTLRGQEVVLDTSEEALDETLNPINKINTLGFADVNLS